VGSLDPLLSERVPGLTPEEAAYIEMKLALSRALREVRLRKNVTQTELARRLHSSQSRVAKMEAADKTVSVDLLLRSLLELGSKPKDIARFIERSRRK
jgi:transcriptional regulator with XRE-family HTH domain